MKQESQQQRFQLFIWANYSFLEWKKILREFIMRTAVWRTPNEREQQPFSRGFMKYKNQMSFS